jgi:hypothetical protein
MATTKSSTDIINTALMEATLQLCDTIRVPEDNRECFVKYYLVKQGVKNVVEHVLNTDYIDILQKLVGYSEIENNDPALEELRIEIEELQMAYESKSEVLSQVVERVDALFAEHSKAVLGESYYMNIMDALAPNN